MAGDQKGGKNGNGKGNCVQCLFNGLGQRVFVCEGHIGTKGGGSPKGGGKGKGKEGGKGGKGGEGGYRMPEWKCGICDFINRAWRTNCFSCGSEKGRACRFSAGDGPITRKGGSRSVSREGKGGHPQGPVNGWGGVSHVPEERSPAGWGCGWTGGASGEGPGFGCLRYG